jgi:hypothetical protein
MHSVLDCFGTSALKNGFSCQLQGGGEEVHLQNLLNESGSTMEPLPR